MIRPVEFVVTLAAGVACGYSLCATAPHAGGRFAFDHGPVDVAGSIVSVPSDLENVYGLSSEVSDARTRVAWSRDIDDALAFLARASTESDVPAIRGDASARLVPSPRGTGGEGFASLDELWSAIDAGRIPSAVSPCESGATLSGGLTRRHLLWPSDRVIEQYGIPSRLRLGTPMRLRYERDPREGTTASVEFAIQDGLVWCVEVDR